MKPEWVGHKTFDEKQVLETRRIFLGKSNGKCMVVMEGGIQILLLETDQVVPVGHQRWSKNSGRWGRGPSLFSPQ